MTPEELLALSPEQLKALEIVSLFPEHPLEDNTGCTGMVD
jgi:hypothetical protein